MKHFSSYSLISMYKIRQIIRKNRKNISLEKQYKFANQAALRMINCRFLDGASNIAIFLSFDGEINTQPLIEKLWKIKKNVYIPIINSFVQRNLLFSSYQPDTKLVKNRFQISEPEFKKDKIISLKNLDIIITPLVAFDKNGNRLGMGKGFYDQVLKNENQCNFTSIGYAYDCQLVNFLKTEEWDIPISKIVTPSMIWTWNK